MDFESLSNSRAVGIFDLLSPPLTPLGAVDAQKLLEAVKESVRAGSKHIVIDGSGLDYLYSDTLNVLGLMGKTLKAHGGSIGVMTSHSAVVKAVSAPGLREMVLHFSEEAELLTASVAPWEEQQARLTQEQQAPESEIALEPSEDSAEVADSAQPDEPDEGVAESSPLVEERVSPEVAEERVPRTLDEIFEESPPVVLETAAESSSAESDDEEITQYLEVIDEGIGSAFLATDPAGSTTTLPIVEELEIRGDEAKSPRKAKNGRSSGRFKRIALGVLLVAALVALVATGILPLPIF